MRVCLIGYTGFVGSNVIDKFNFTNVFNSKNVQDAYGLNPDVLVYAGVRAEKFLANQFPNKDLENIEEAFENIRKINPKQLVLISTIDIYEKPINVDEDSLISTESLHPYGLNRYYLEQWVEKEYKNALIIRLPGLYGKNIKKNFIYDLIHIIPNLLTLEKFKELYTVDSKIEKYYELLENGYYKCKQLSDNERILAKQYFNDIGFSALNFTDSRGSFQFYNLNNLWNHIEIALENRIHKLNLATEPVFIKDIYKTIKGKEFNNEISSSIPSYNFKTKHADLFQGSNGYIFTKEEVLADIKKFVEGYII